MVSGRRRGQDRWALVVIAGDIDSANPNHPATDSAIAHAAGDLGLEVRTRWSATAAFDVDPSEVLDGAAALFLTTGSPYGSLDGALAAIKYARTASHIVKLMRSAQDPGVVDHDVDPAEPLDRKPHERRSPGPARDVVGVGGGAAPGRQDLLDDLLSRPPVRTRSVGPAAQVVDDHLGALVCQ